ncbi:unnamed protein product [Allacma fusca]|uniref:Calcium channel flower n=1 Tax=Allacma fusca TaxID=39272 RepID=A0A8J2JSV5_9HEXA|nr:unnamed protein product [Allacma fusca]
MQNSASGQLNPDPKEEAPWYIKYGVRVLGTVGGGLAMLLGLVAVVTSILSFSPFCIVLSIWQMVLGFGVIVIESPYCCVFVEHVATIAQKVESKPLIVKAAVYVFGPMPTVIFCFGLNTLFGNALIVAAGVIYGFMALGKKADRAEMAANASQHAPTSYNPPAPSKVTVTNERNFAPPPRPVAPTFENPPPPYTDLQSSNISGTMGWDTSYLQSSTSNLATEPYRNSSNPASSDKPVTPYNNPFQ